MESQEDKEKIVCVCKQEFTEKTIFRHLNHPKRKSCKEDFDKGKYESLMAAKNVSRKQYKKDYNEKNGPELRAREKFNYAENPSPAKKRSKNYHAENKETISQKRKESYSQNKENLFSLFSSILIGRLLVVGSSMPAWARKRHFVWK